MSLPVFDRSVLEGVNPRGRVDVLASNVLQWAASNRGLAPQFEAVRPVIDFGLLYFLGPEKEFARAVKTLSSPKRKKNPQPARRIAAGRLQSGARRPSRARSRRVEVLDAEVVSL